MKTYPYSHQWIDNDDVDQVVEVLKSGWLTQGPAIKRFEDKLCEYTGAKYAVCVSHGTAALHMACLAAGIRAKDEVITSPLTFVASANCVLYCQGRPVFADIERDNGNIDPTAIQRINKKTKAIIPVHYAGYPYDLMEINRLAKKNNLLVIEDACHALGAEYKVNGQWIKIGSCQDSDMAIFSFHPVKSITTGEGGAILTNHRDFYEKLLILRSHGITRDQEKFKVKNSKENGDWYYEMQELGFNYRITDIQCALGVSQMKKIDQFIKRRREIARTYQEAFQGNEFFDLPPEAEQSFWKSSCHLYPIRLKDRYKKKKKMIFHRLKELGLGVQVHYIPVYWQPLYQQLGYQKGLCPKAEDFYEREISIPLYPAMRDEDVNFIIKILFKTFGEMFLRPVVEIST